MRVKYHVSIDCANCASEVEEAISKIDSVERVVVDFINKTMTVDIYDSLSCNFEEVEDGIHKAAVAAEPDFEMWPMDEEEEEEKQRFPYSLAVGIIFLVAGLVIEHLVEADIDGIVLRGIFLIGLLITGYDIFIRAFKNIIGKKFLDENFLMAIATVAALAIGYWTESVAIMVFYKIGEFFEERAVRRSRSSVKALLSLKSPYSTIIRDGKELTVRSETVDVGETVIIRPGDMIPIDGVIVKGESFIDTKTMTGEPVPRHVTEGDEVLSGFVNTDSVLYIRTTRQYEDSAAAKVLSLIEDSHTKKSQSEKFITKFAKYYTPAVVFLAAVIAIVPSILYPDTWEGWAYKGIVFLVVSCPCALVLSIPLSYFCGIGNASRHGVLVKGSTYIESLSKCSTVVFDKTGTLTHGDFKVVSVEPSGITAEELIMIAASVESRSNHPIARSICSYAGDYDRDVSDDRNIAGKGIAATVDGKLVTVGNASLMNEIGIDILDPLSVGTHVHVAIDGIYAGHILISDTVKDDSKDAVERLRSMGISTCLLTGDSKVIGESTAKELGVDEYHSELMPEDKTAILEGMIALSKGSVAFVGDGINDAPSLSRSDVGIAMGALGSDAAIEAADMVIVDDNPSKVADAVEISRKTQRIVWENIIFALAMKFSILALTTFTDIVSMWAAIIADVGVLVIAVANATRALGRMAPVSKMEKECNGNCCHCE